MSSLLLILLLFLFIQACNGRELGFDIKDELAMMDADRISPSLMKPLNSGATIIEGRQNAFDEKKKKKTIEAISGTAVVMTSLHIGFPEIIKSQVGSSKQHRLLLGIRSGDQEMVESEESASVADLGAMDYQNPRGGPSIHNR